MAMAARLQAAPLDASAVTPFAIGAAFLLLFESIAWAASHGQFRAFDHQVLAALEPRGDPRRSLVAAWETIAANDFSAMGSVSVLAFIVVLVSGLFFSLKRRQEALVLMVSSGGGLVLANGLKDLFDIGRPPLTPEAAAGLNASFPSGHAMLSAVVYLTLGALVGHFAERRLVRYYAMGAAILLTLLIGLARIALGVHWCSDVLGGWCVGVGWALMWRGAAVSLWRARVGGS